MSLFKPPPSAAHVATGLRLAATPILGVLATVSYLNPVPNILCGSGIVPAHLDMGLMYLLMAAFHLPAWLTLLDGGQKTSSTPHKGLERA